MTEHYSVEHFDADVPLVLLKRKGSRPTDANVVLVTGRKAGELLDSGRYERVTPSELEPAGITTRERAEIIHRYIEGQRNIGTVSTIWGFNWGDGPAAGVAYGNPD